MSDLTYMSICNENGHLLPTHYRHDGQLFVEAVPGTAYKVVFHNPTDHRVLLVTSVDGLDIRSGRSASVYLPGVVIDGRGVVVLTSPDPASAGKFIFADPDLAFAMGTNPNVGVIAVAAFREYIPRSNHQGSSVYGNELFIKAERLPDNDDADKCNDINYSMGDTSFRRAPDGPHQIVIIRYATRAWLIREGIIIPTEPIAYPADRWRYPTSK